MTPSNQIRLPPARHPCLLSVISLKKYGYSCQTKIYSVLKKSLSVFVHLRFFSVLCDCRVSLLFEVQCLIFLLSFSFVQYWQGYVILALESHLVSLNQKFNSQFPFSPKGKDYLTLRLWLESVIECHVDGFKVPFSHWRAEDISAKLLSASHTWIFILLDA